MTFLRSGNCLFWMQGLLWKSLHVMWKCRGWMSPSALDPLQLWCLNSLCFNGNPWPTSYWRTMVSLGVLSSYIIALVLSGEGHPFHPSVPSFVPSSKFLIPGWKTRTTTTIGGRNNFIQMWSAELAREPVGGEELGPLRAMTATGAGLSLALNTTTAKP
jgi:hypothetical protein